MVALMPKSWLKVGFGSAYDANQTPSDSLGILAFEAAATMAKLVSLHQTLSDSEIRKFRSNMRSQGISYLTSPDQVYLLQLACAEILRDLDLAADGVARLSERCQTTFPRAFKHTYSDAKHGSLGSLLEEFKFNKGLDQRIKKMEKLTMVTCRLYNEMDTLNDLEMSESKMEEWKKHSGPIPAQETLQKFQFESDSLRRVLKSQRQRVRKLMEESLWCSTFDKAVGMMAKVSLSILYKLCLTFGQHVNGLPPVFNNTVYSYAPKIKYSSGPLESPKPNVHEIPILRHSAPIFVRQDELSKPLDKLVKSLTPPQGTVGNSGMAKRYANVISSAEKLLALQSGNQILSRDEDGEGDEEEWGTREELYELLPMNVRSAVKAKLKECWKKNAGEMADRDVADGWGQAVQGILSWLGPMARDTVKWHDERNMDRTQRFSTSSRMLMVQTLHFADVEKTEAAIVEVLVGLSCMCWYHEQRGGSVRSTRGPTASGSDPNLFIFSSLFLPSFPFSRPPLSPSSSQLSSI
ncbi:hypothetical protein LUZ60_012936 [Juncus effusus]|nr:hypothetical protein LUZ60_012936 [Juncus effusus]